MISGPVLGGAWLAAYYGVGAAVQEPEPQPQPEQPQGATGAGGPSFPGWSAPRFRGQRQRVVDGQFLDDDAAIEEIGAPRRADDIPFEPPKPWTPDSDVEEPDPEEAVSGQAGLGISFPKRREIPREPPGPREIRRTEPNPDEDAIAYLLLIIGATWT